MSGAIPIRNLYYLLCYAWDKLEARGFAPVFADGQRDVTNLMARILTGTASYVVRRGIDRTYGERAEMMHTVRGRLDVAGTFARTGGVPGRVLCRYEELGPDVLHNQVMKGALRRVLKTKEVALANRREAAVVLKRLREVSEIELTSSLLARVQLHRNNAYYGVMLDACELLLTNSLPAENGDHYVLREFGGTPADMARLFERFIANFYKREQTRYKVTGRQLTWDDLTGSPEDLQHLPIQRTDVVLRSPRQAIVIDCKFYREALRSGMRTESLRPDHLRQIRTYAEILRDQLPPDVAIEGMLLYPVVKREKMIDLTSKRGYRLTVKFINLNQDWRKIHDDLLRIAGIYEGDLAEPIGRVIIKSANTPADSTPAAVRTRPQRSTPGSASPHGLRRNLGE